MIIVSLKNGENAGFPCWIGDLNWVIGHLPGHSQTTPIHVEIMSYEELVNLRDNLDRTCDQSLQSFVDSSPKCLLIRGRLEAAGNGQRVHMTRKLRHYLLFRHIAVPSLGLRK